MTNSILLVLTSHESLGDTGQKTGSWLEELAASYYVLLDGGCTVALASIAGGAAPLDPASLAEPWLTQAGKRFLADEAAMTKLNDTAAIGAIDPAVYDAVYMIGGAGSDWDFPRNAALAGLLAATAKRGKVVAGVCHGVVGFLNEVDGVPIARGLRLTAISDAEEAMIGYDKIVPVLPESGLRAAGAVVAVAPPLEGHVVKDGIFVTGQNPASASLVAAEILKMLSI